ncbi:hypothetical protein VNO80_28832 [Phaseolus coccineus]|uniref:Uncharacterized protein n=1 Tax=Phaseolus coccineus TaxID=3886 RepID=A0AAN9L9T6_PHACN
MLSVGDHPEKEESVKGDWGNEGTNGFAGAGAGVAGTDLAGGLGASAEEESVMGDWGNEGTNGFAGAGAGVAGTDLAGGLGASAVMKISYSARRLRWYVKSDKVTEGDFTVVAAASCLEVQKEKDRELGCKKIKAFVADSFFLSPNADLLRD